MSSCKKQTSKKYTSRPSPPYPANECCGQVKTGNDGLKYMSVEAANGVCRWVKTVTRKSPRAARKSPRKTRKTYSIHDNGGRPFRVRVGSGGAVEVLVHTGNTYEPFKSFSASRVLLGKQSPLPNRESSPVGNNILLELSSGKYLYIGSVIREFKPLKGDVLTKFYSDIGNNDVPYAYAIGANHIYFFDEFPSGKVVAVEKSYFTDKSYYDQYYKPRFVAARARIAELKDKSVKLSSKLVHDRL